MPVNFNAMCNEIDRQVGHLAHAAQKRFNKVDAQATRNFNQLRTKIEGVSKNLEGVSKDLTKTISLLKKENLEQRAEIDALKGGSDAQKAFAKSYNDSNRVWNKIANIESSALKVLAYIGYVLASILTLGILPAVDFTSKSFTPEMAKNFAAQNNNKQQLFRELSESTKVQKDTSVEEGKAEVESRVGVKGSKETISYRDSANVKRLALLERADKIIADPKSTEKEKARAKRYIEMIEAKFSVFKGLAAKKIEKTKAHKEAQKKSKEEKAKGSGETYAKAVELAARNKVAHKDHKALLAKAAKEAAAKAKAAAKAPAAQAPAAPVVDNKPKA